VAINSSHRVFESGNTLPGFVNLSLNRDRWPQDPPHPRCSPGVTSLSLSARTAGDGRRDGSSGADTSHVTAIRQLRDATRNANDISQSGIIVRDQTLRRDNTVNSASTKPIGQRDIHRSSQAALPLTHRVTCPCPGALRGDCRFCTPSAIAPRHAIRGNPSAHKEPLT